jgi:hypothetical protein
VGDPDNNPMNKPSWTNLNENGCKEAAPYKTGSPSYLESQSDAVSEFTVENGYYEMYGVYKKQ